jgi:ribosomal protein S18 acetylase RimI-like enzyme
MGICSFGGQGSALEITGMVHPEYRRQGIFTILNEFVLAECKRRNSGSILLLCDKKSNSGQKFMEKVGALYKYSEFEMYLQEDSPEPNEKQLCGITLRKAENSDAYEIARQNAIYFDDCAQEEDPNLGQNESKTIFEESIPKDDILLPEDEEKRGMTIYLAEKDKQNIGKVHLQVSDAVGGIYGLGILPEHRGKGFGRAILLRAIEKLKEANINNIMLQVAAENATALRLYKSTGFKETSTMDYFELKA